MFASPPLLLGVVDGPARGENVFIYPGESLSVGRRLGSELRLRDPDVSGRHGRFFYRESGLFYEDLGSSNGSFDAQRQLIHGPLSLAPGRRLRLGSSTILVFPPDPETPSYPNLFLRRLLGHGAQARVYEANWPPYGPIALKAFAASLPPKDRKRCEREGRLMQRLNHPSISRCFDVIEQGPQLLLVSELIRGESLELRLSSSGPLEWQVAAELGAAAAETLAFAHEHGVLHRDIKPGNMLIEEGSRALKIIDFGFARLLVRAQHSIDLTSLGETIGTEDYLAPEGFESGRDLDARADIYSLAATIYELVVGYPPFPGRNISSRLERRHQPIAPITTAPAALTQVLQGGLAYSLSERISSMRSFAAQLRSLL